MSSLTSLAADGLRDLYATAKWTDAMLSAPNQDLALRALGLLGELPGRRILDLACGSCALGVELAAMGFTVTGLDLYTPNAARRAALRKVRINLLEQDMAALDRPGEFDAVINWDISGLAMFPADTQTADVLRRIGEALVPGGKFLLETFYEPWIARHGEIEGMKYDPVTRRASGMIERMTPAGTLRQWPLSFRAFSLDEWKTMLLAAGLQPIRTAGGLGGEDLTSRSKLLSIVALKPLTPADPAAFAYLDA